MTDQQIPADDLRRFIARCRTAVNGRGSILLDELEALLPDPPRPTLADMTEEERRECRWMQCDVIGWSERPVIAPIHHDNGTAMVMCEDGTNDTLDTRQIIPRPDLPRLEWPGDATTGPDHLAVGTVIESADDPRIAALPVGSILLDRNEEAVIKMRGDWTGEGYIPIAYERDKYGPWTVLHITKEADQ